MLSRSKSHLDGSNRFISSILKSPHLFSPTGEQPSTVSLKEFCRDGSNWHSGVSLQTRDDHVSPLAQDIEVESQYKSVEGDKEEDPGLSLKVILGIDSGRILSYSSPKVIHKTSGLRDAIRKSPTKSKHNASLSLTSLDLVINQFQLASPFSEYYIKSKSKKSWVSVPNYIPYRVLDAPGLRNDFYSNLISWSSKTNNIAVGLDRQVYLWNNQDGVSLVKMDNRGIITCISFSKSDFFLVGTSTGNLCLLSQTQNKVIGRVRIEGAGICCLHWSKCDSFFFVGDSKGVVTCYEIVIIPRKERDYNSMYAITFVKRSCFIFHKQQICGIALSKEENEIAIGGNDNYCTIWDISQIGSPILKHLLPHNAAVKAIAYCPWSKALLATGGGTRDRNLRFWHTTTGTLLHIFDTTYQITSLIWSTFSKEIVVTFGFGDDNNRLIVAGYTFPNLSQVFKVNAGTNLRILSAILSPDNESICVTTNDETIRFYKIWKHTSHPLVCSPETPSFGVYGSPIIELFEGVNKKGEVIR
ncbi:meiosis-specific APC/C activator protein Ama1p [[Candida] railenensis]|uniref:Meiosis-specific APC/C activator protein Ama1p n=1 Tax=[Candida] railenensis TaxID=45579 RepID=A0A9P0QLF9_9ASCO|nr:meiosis-specific APC/C activator protein Ama1p [[Candida] railenensis]